MIYTQIDPHPYLTDYIDAYWTAAGHEKDSLVERILPDGCVDIIFNCGEDCETDNGNFTMQSEKTYLVGTMTSFKETEMNPGTKLMGVRFKPAAFSAFHKFSSLHEITDQTIELENKLTPCFTLRSGSLTDYLNQYFLNKLSKPKHNLIPVIADIQKQMGQVNVAALAQRHFTTKRQLERSFKQYIGLSPKEFINIVRYQYALLKIQGKPHDQSFSTISFECGYYDHAHLTNEVKRYTGSAPSQL